MNLQIRLRRLVFELGSQTAGLLILISTLFIHPIGTIALDTDAGGSLFKQHCSGCHVNGGNIIRRNKTLRLKALEHNGLDNPQAIARVAREGIGQMSGYQDVLGDSGDQLVAAWIWAQAQNAWTQG